MADRYYIETYGCQMNVADSQVVAGLLDQHGYRRTELLNEADVILLNTCAIREKAEEKVRNRLDHLASLKRKNPAILIGLLGCMAKNLADSILESRPYVDLILGPDSYRRLPKLLAERRQGNEHQVDVKLSRMEVYEDLFPSRGTGLNAWISIMRGCDKFCTFCVVPYTRGRERSRSLDSIIAEAADAVARGFVEMTLLGQNVNSYRHQEVRFPELLAAVAEVPGVRRIRFTSPHPSDVDDRMLEVMAAYENICPSIHLPLQSGSDRILRRMQRSYTQAEYLRLVERIRHYLPGVTLTTDIITGFPGETDADFEATLKVVAEVEYDSAFTFKYSLRPGTKAAEFSDQVSDALSQKRLEALIALQKVITLKRNRALVGAQLEVLVEKESKKSAAQWAGRSATNKWVIFDRADALPGDFVQVHIDSSYGVALQGHIVTTAETYHAVA